MEAAEWVVVGVCAVACVFDLRSRRIPNALTLGSTAIAIGFHIAQDGVSGAGHAAGGWLTGVVLFFPLFALGGMGAGDVKLLAAIGAWLGPSQALWTALYASIAGGVMALVVAAMHGYMMKAIENVQFLILHWRIAGLRPHAELVLTRAPGTPRLAFALPIAAGAAAAIWLR
jgi:prepilin peptidase CpaA